MSDPEDWRDRGLAVVTLLVLGAGFVGMFFSLDNFWLIWVLGFAVLVPILATLLGVEGEDDADDEDEWTAEPTERSLRRPRRERGDSRDPPTGADALETLRERYARGDLTDEQFERKLERLLETETIEDVEDAERARERLAADGRHESRGSETVTDTDTKNDTDTRNDTDTKNDTGIGRDDERVRTERES